jgi:hypothetical protein
MRSPHWNRERHHPASITDVDALADEVAALEQRAAAAEYNFGVEHDEVRRLREAIQDDVPTPERLEAWAEWFDDPNEVGLVVVESFSRDKKYTAGYVLRRIADSFRALTEGKNDGTAER